MDGQAGGAADDGRRSPREPEPSGRSRPRLIAIDIDGTLLAPGAVLAPAVQPAVARALSAGAMVTLASGRMFVSVVALAERLGLRGPLIAYNGALVRTHPDGQTWSHQPVPLPVARRVVAACHAAGWYVQAYLDDRLLVPWRDERTDWYSRNAGVPFTVDPARVHDLPEAPTKLLVIEPPERMPDIRAAILEASRPDVVVMGTSFGNYLEVTAPGVDKGVALRAVAERLGVPVEAVMAVGDGENDLPLLAAAGLRVAVGNAGSRLRAAADLVTAAPYGDGVAEAIDRFLG